jgi:hypothetical protein
MVLALTVPVGCSASPAGDLTVENRCTDPIRVAVSYDTEGYWPSNETLLDIGDSVTFSRGTLARSFALLIVRPTDDEFYLSTDLVALSYAGPDARGGDHRIVLGGFLCP